MLGAKLEGVLIPQTTGLENNLIPCHSGGVFREAREVNHTFSVRRGRRVSQGAARSPDSPRLGVIMIAPSAAGFKRNSNGAVVQLKRTRGFWGRVVFQARCFSRISRELC